MTTERYEDSPVDSEPASTALRWREAFSLFSRVDVGAGIVWPHHRRLGLRPSRTPSAVMCRTCLFEPSMARSAPPVTPVVAVADDIGAVAADRRLTASTGQAGSLRAVAEGR